MRCDVIWNLFVSLTTILVAENAQGTLLNSTSTQTDAKAGPLVVAPGVWQPTKWLSGLETRKTCKALPAADSEDVKNFTKKNRELELTLQKLEEEVKEEKLNMTLLQRLHSEQLAHCELKVKNTQLEEEVLRLKQDAQVQVAISTTRMELQDARLQHARDKASLLQEKRAALDETARYRRKVEDFESALEKVRGECARETEDLRREIAELKNRTDDLYQSNSIMNKTFLIKLSKTENKQNENIKNYILQFKDLQTLNNSQIATKKILNDIEKNIVYIQQKNNLSYLNYNLTELKLEEIKSKIESDERFDDVKKLVQNLTVLQAETARKLNDHKKDLEVLSNEIIGLNTIAMSTKHQVEPLTEKVSNLETEKTQMKEKASALKLSLEELTGRVDKLMEVEDKLDKRINKIKNLNLIKLGDKFYYFGSEKPKKSWVEAQSDCRSLGLELVTLETKGENILVDEHRKKHFGHQQMWLGGTDEGHEGHWVWSGTQRELTYTNWSSGDPNGGTSQNCLIICSDANGGSWCDRQCSATAYYACEL